MEKILNYFSLKLIFNIKLIYIKNMSNKKIKLEEEEKSKSIIIKEDINSIYINEQLYNGNHLILQCKNKKTLENGICKQFVFKEDDDYIDGNCLREISIMKKLEHPNIIRLNSILINGINISHITNEYPWTLSSAINRFFKCVKLDVKNIAFQLISALAYLHENNIIHRDLKINNIYLSEDYEKVIIADFDKSFINSNILKFDGFTNVIKPPELLLSKDDNNYGFETDIWSLGCVILSVAIDKMFLNFDNEKSILLEILRIFEYPQNIYNFSEEFTNKNPIGLRKYYYNITKIEIDPQLLSLLESMLKINNKERISASDALKHSYFKDYIPIKYPPLKIHIYELAYPKGIDKNMHKILLDWLKEVHNLNNAIVNANKYESYIDRCLIYAHKTNYNINKNNLQLLGTICYKIDFSIHNDYHFNMSCAELCDTKYYKGEIIKKMLYFVLEALDFDLI
jgi:serine/threonine protein kinase